LCTGALLAIGAKQVQNEVAGFHYITAARINWLKM